MGISDRYRINRVRKTGGTKTDGGSSICLLYCQAYVKRFSGTFLSYTRMNFKYFNFTEMRKTIRVYRTGKGK